MADRSARRAQGRRRAARMAGRSLLLGVLLGAGVLAGCGSSSSGGEFASRPPTTTTGPSPSPSTGTTSASGSSLKVQGRPKFATPSSSEPVRSGTVQISYRNITAHPVTLRVKAGTVVRFVNYDPVQHNATSVGGAAGAQKFASRNFGQGGSFEVKLTKPGLVHFECTIHSATINGTIEVL
jgi:plastocyanin